MAGNQEDGYSCEALLQRLEEVLHDEREDPIPLPLPLLQQITKNFSEDEEIGRGGFAVVYKGRLPRGKVVAVKKIDTSKADARYLEREIACMMRAKHKNVVRLLGYYRPPEPENELILCSEYVPNGSLSRYLKDISCRLQWSTRYQIILGICEGIQYLHRPDVAIVHRDLKPENILLDHNLGPKIADFGLSKRLDVDKSHDITFGGGGTIRYLAPEIYEFSEFSTRSDIYGLGLVIMDILVGRDEYTKFLWSPDERGHDKINKVLQTWTKAFMTQRTNNIPPRLQKQVKVCAAIAMQCLHIMDPEDVKKYMADKDDPYMTVNYQRGSSSNFLPSLREMAYRSKERPSATEIVDWLGATENWSSMSQQFFQLNLSTESEVLDIHPRVLCFHFGEHVASSCCVLNLTNKSPDYCVSFWIETQKGIITCTYDGLNCVAPLTTRAVTAELHSVKREGYPPVVPVDTGRVNIVTVTMTKVRVRDAMFYWPPIIFEPGTLVKVTTPPRSTLESLGEVHEALLAVVVCPLPSQKKIPSSKRTMDVHPTKPWILINEYRRVCIWNYQTEKPEKVYEHKKNTMVTLVKFIPRDKEHRIVIGDSSGFIYVISWTKNNDDDDDDDRGEITKTLSRPDNKVVAITSLAIHPKVSLLLWADDDGMINLQSWKGQTFIRTYEGGLPLVATQVKFLPNDKYSFIEACGLIKVWKITSFSTQPTIATLGERGERESQGATERRDPVRLFDYPYTDTDRQHTIAILRGGDAEIWDLEAQDMVCELSFDRSATAIACHPIHPVIVLGTKDWHTNTVNISLYNSNNYRIEKVIKYTHDARIQEFGFLCSKWLVVRYTNDEIEVLEIDMAYLQ